jgi:hypothetical protein|tara:strand:+ start:82 stop:684 length:603 start_codon:yes stop_codon:yes gene_type:complete
MQPYNQEGFKPSFKRECPNLLIQENNEIFLYNTKKANVPGVNPIKFNNLDEYTEFVDWQRSQKINCPILFLQKNYNAQGNTVYTARSSPENLRGGLSNMYIRNEKFDNDFEDNEFEDNEFEDKEYSKLLDASRDDPPYNKNSHPAYDQQNQYIGINTPLDKMYNEKGSVSANPMDTRWGGQKYTQSLIDKGLYQDNNIKL